MGRPSLLWSFIPLSSSLHRLSAAEQEATGTVSWRKEPDGRGTIQLVISCVLTFVLCVWSALHLNVPRKASSHSDHARSRTKWILIGILAPELVVSTAFAQYIRARWLLREIQRDTSHCKSANAHDGGTTSTTSRGTGSDPETWTMCHCFFAVMGGITIQTGDSFENNPNLTLSAEGVRLLSFLGHLPKITKKSIEDKSKADGLSKTLVCFQAGWMIIQFLGRLVQRLPVTLLEINTLGHVLCALILYLLWWNKPFEVQDPVILSDADGSDATMALMWMCSPVSAREGVSEARCLRYHPPDQRQNEEDLAVAHSPRSPDYTRFSVGSPASRNPSKFLGPVDAITRGQSNIQLDEPLARRVSYTIDETKNTAAPEHQIFFTIQDNSTALRHSKRYCRRGYPDCLDRTPLDSHQLRRWRLAGDVVDKVWAQCQVRPSYEEYYFTKSSLGFFLGEIPYVVTHVPNFSGLSGLGHANIHRDHLKSILAFAAALYGGLHAGAWNHHFVTEYERIAWMVSALLIASTGVVFWAFFFAKQTSKSFDRWTTHGIFQDAGKPLPWSRPVPQQHKKVMSRCLTAGAFSLFALARIYLVLEAFVSLRKVPAGVYDTPEWSQLIPHI